VVSIWASKETLMYAINPSYLLSQMGHSQLIERGELCTQSGDSECVRLVHQRLLELSQVEGSSLPMTNSSFEKMRGVENLVIVKPPRTSCSSREPLSTPYSRGDPSHSAGTCETGKKKSFH